MYMPQYRREDDKECEVMLYRTTAGTVWFLSFIFAIVGILVFTADCCGSYFSQPEDDDKCKDEKSSGGLFQQCGKSKPKCYDIAIWAFVVVLASLFLFLCGLGCCLYSCFAVGDSGRDRYVHNQRGARGPGDFLAASAYTHDVPYSGKGRKSKKKKKRRRSSDSSYDDRAGNRDYSRYERHTQIPPPLQIVGGGSQYYAQAPPQCSQPVNPYADARPYCGARPSTSVPLTAYGNSVPIGNSVPVEYSQPISPRGGGYSGRAYGGRPSSPRGAQPVYSR